MAKSTKAKSSNLQERNEKIVALYKEGMSGTAIAKEVGLSSPMVYMILQKAGASKNEPAKKRPGRPAKIELNNLSERNEKIVALYKEGMSGNAIAKQVGLSGQMVYIILQKAGVSKYEPAKITKKRPGRPAKIAPKIRKTKAITPEAEISIESDADKRAMDKLLAALTEFLKERNMTLPSATSNTLAEQAPKIVKKRRGRPPKGN